MTRISRASGLWPVAGVEGLGEHAVGQELRRLHVHDVEDAVHEALLDAGAAAAWTDARLTLERDLRSGGEVDEVLDRHEPLPGPLALRRPVGAVDHLADEAG